MKSWIQRLVGPGEFVQKPVHLFNSILTAKRNSQTAPGLFHRPPYPGEYFGGFFCVSATGATQAYINFLSFQMMQQHFAFNRRKTKINNC